MPSLLTVKSLKTFTVQYPIVTVNLTKQSLYTLLIARENRRKNKRGLKRSVYVGSWLVLGSFINRN